MYMFLLNPTILFLHVGVNSPTQSPVGACSDCRNTVKGVSIGSISIPFLLPGVTTARINSARTIDFS